MDFVVGQAAGSQIAEVMEAKLAHQERMAWAMATYNLGLLHGQALKFGAAVEELRKNIEWWLEAVEPETGLVLRDALFIEGLEEVLGEHDGEEST